MNVTAVSTNLILPSAETAQPDQAQGRPSTGFEAILDQGRRDLGQQADPALDPELHSVDLAQPQPQLQSAQFIDRFARVDALKARLEGRSSEDAEAFEWSGVFGRGGKPAAGSQPPTDGPLVATIDTLNVRPLPDDRPVVFTRADEAAAAQLRPELAGGRFDRAEADPQLRTSGTIDVQLGSPRGAERPTPPRLVASPAGPPSVDTNYEAVESDAAEASRVLDRLVGRRADAGANSPIRVSLQASERGLIVLTRLPESLSPEEQLEMRRRISAMLADYAEGLGDVVFDQVAFPTAHTPNAGGLNARSHANRR